MKLLDLNLLIYAVNRDSAHHATARKWLDRVLNEDEPIGLPWIVLLGFLRLTTNARVLPNPLTPDQALGLVDGWIGQPGVRIPAPGEEHWRILRSLLTESGTAGNLTSDAHLAALAVESGSTLYSTDADFSRFRGVRWANPLKD